VSAVVLLALAYKFDLHGKTWGKMKEIYNKFDVRRLQKGNPPKNEQLDTDDKGKKQFPDNEGFQPPLQK
jgi:hypothetical protein